MPNLDLLFNGYRLDYRNFLRYDAWQPLKFSRMLPGIYTVGDPNNALSIFRGSKQVNASYFTNACNPVKQCLPNTNKYVLSMPIRNRLVCSSRFYLYDGTNSAWPGIRVDTAFFNCMSFYTNIAGMLDGMKLKVSYSAPWMLTALDELGEKEVPGKKANPVILQYFKASRFWGTDDSGGQNAWCASFMSWVMKKHNYTIPAHAFRAKSWKTFGKKIANPIYGAIGIKSRTGGGHVAFVVGKSEDGKYLFMLGGNQHDEVSITRYRKSVWDTFVVPTNHDISKESLPVYTRAAVDAGSES